MQARNWIFTINNPEEEEILTSELLWMNNLKFLLAIPEIGEEGTFHYQGYLELREPRALVWLKKRLPRAHLEKRRGSRNQAVRYCLKTVKEPNPEQAQSERYQTIQEIFEADPGFHLAMPILYPCAEGLTELCSELMNLKMSSKDSRKSSTIKEQLEVIRRKIQNGASDKDIANEHFDVWCKNHRAISRYRTIITPQRNHDVEVIVIQGPTGTGKSKWCKDKYPDAYWKQRSQWWCNYENHETVVVDEFYGWLPFDLVLRLCDRYPLLVESKGGQIQFTAKRIIFTSNRDPRMWWKNVYFKSFIRRVTEWKIMPNLGEVITSDNFNDIKRHIINDLD